LGRVSVILARGWEIHSEIQQCIRSRCASAAAMSRAHADGPRGCARRALLSGSALVSAGLCLSLAVVPTPVLAVDISTQAQLDAAIAAGQTTINIVAGNLALSNAQTLRPAPTSLLRRAPACRPPATRRLVRFPALEL